jgi:RNA polymerase sigma-70 factor (ECF subfamily)
MEEAELIRCSQQGDVQAFNILVERYQKEALNFAIRMLGNLPDAEDICQDSWLAAWESIRRFKGGSFRTWVLHIVANDCRDEFRRRKKRVSISVTDSPPPIMADPKGNTALSHEMIEAVQETLLQLPHEQRLAITLREFNGLSYDEIAKVMRCSTGTVRSRLNRGRINLRDLLRDRGFFE